MFKKTEPFKVTAVRSHTLFIDDKGVENFVSVYRVTLLHSSPNLPASSASERKSLLPAADEVIYNETETEENIPTSNNRRKVPEEYAVERIVRYNGPQSGRRYKFRCYG